MNGSEPLTLTAFCRSSRARSFFALRLADNNGLVAVTSRPSASQVQVPGSPKTRPGRLLISVRNSPIGVSRSRSTSLMLPSRAMNSKLAHAR
jgi:hypothetical protein